jgi:hypothetical protein
VVETTRKFRLLLGEKAISIVLSTVTIPVVLSVSNNDAVPDKEKLLVKGPSGFVTVVLKVRFWSGVTGIESVMVIAGPEVGVRVIV